MPITQTGEAFSCFTFTAHTCIIYPHTARKAATLSESIHALHTDTNQLRSVFLTRWRITGCSALRLVAYHEKDAPSTSFETNHKNVLVTTKRTKRENK